MPVHDDMYSVKYKQADTLHELVLAEPDRQIRENYAMFKVTSLIDFHPYHKSLSIWINVLIG